MHYKHIIRAVNRGKCMSLQIQQQDDSTIYCVRMMGHMTVQQLRASFAHFASIAADGDRSQLYRVVDFTGFTADLTTRQQLARLMSTQIPGSYRDPRIKTVLTCSQCYPHMAILLMTKHNLLLPVFSSVADAIDAINALNHGNATHHA